MKKNFLHIFSSTKGGIYKTLTSLNFSLKFFKDNLPNSVQIDSSSNVNAASETPEDELRIRFGILLPDRSIDTPLGPQADIDNTYQIHTFNPVVNEINKEVISFDADKVSKGESKKRGFLLSMQNLLKGIWHFLKNVRKQQKLF